MKTRALFRHAISRLARSILRTSATYTPESSKTLQQGGVLVCSNHVSLIDGIVVALTSPTPLVFGVDTSFSRHSRLAMCGMNVLTRLGFGRVVPIDSNAPHGIRHLARVLCEGGNVMIFPEGEIRPKGNAIPDRPGVEWLRKRTGAKLLRITIQGAEDSRLFAKQGKRLWPHIIVNY